MDSSAPGVTTAYLGTGDYSVDFNTNVSQCAYVAQIGGPGTSAPTRGLALTYLRSGFTDQVHVETWEDATSASGNRRDRPFHIAVYC